tara:strand:+ start:151411 stop:152790 length:1380 start_codon:yes stop_codon:yes gene_type:complete
MKKRTIPFLLVILFSVYTTAQIDSTKVDIIKTISNTDSLKNTESVKKVLQLFLSDTIPPIKPLDSVKIVQLNDTLNIRMRLDSLGIYMPTDTIRRLTKLDSLKLKTDALLKPYYTIRYDSLIQEDIYTPRFRMSINHLSKDTVYIPIPKETKSYISIKSKLVVDTLKVLNVIKRVAIDTTKYADDPIWWKHKNSVGFDVNQAAFLNWSAGGNSSVSGLVKVNFERTYKKLLLLWRNEVYARYGLNKQEDRELRKTDDKLEINSTFGYRKDTISNWYYSLKFNFKTQFTDGFSYPDTQTPISRIFSPAYLFLGAGAQYDLKKDRFLIYLSPITLKSTFVFDENLSNDGAFGVKVGENARHEFGALIETRWNEQIVKNVIMDNKFSLYSDYLNNFGNIDVNWELNFKLKVNKFFQANIGAHLIYDDDIKFKEDTNNDGILETTGARVQLKQLFGIGVLYQF